MVDVLVISLLGYVILSNNGNNAKNSETTQHISETCSLRLLEALTPDHRYRPAVAYDQADGELFVTLRISITSTVHSDIVGPHGRWATRTELTPHLIQQCPEAATLILTVEDATHQGTVYHVARLPAHAVLTWANGEMSDDQLAAASEYRLVQGQAQASPSSPQD